MQKKAHALGYACSNCRNTDNIKDRLKVNIHFWHKIGAEYIISGITENGLKLPLLGNAPKACIHDNFSAEIKRNKEKNVREALIDLVSSDRVIKQYYFTNRLITKTTFSKCENLRQEN